MRRRAVAGLLGLLAVVPGCTHPRSEMPMPKLGPPAPAAALRDDLPSIHDTINQGTRSSPPGRADGAQHSAVTPAEAAEPPGRPAPFPIAEGVDPRTDPDVSRADSPRRVKMTPFFAQPGPEPDGSRPGDLPPLPDPSVEPPPPVEAGPPLDQGFAPAAFEPAPGPDPAAPVELPPDFQPAPIAPDAASASGAVVVPAPAVGPAPAPAGTSPDPATEAAIRNDLQLRSLPMIGSIAAQVGTETIAFSKLDRAVREQLKGVPADQRPTREQLDMIAGRILDGLIDKALILNEAKRFLKNPQQRKIFHEAVDAEWRASELPPLMRQHAAANEFELKAKLEEKGQSLDAMRDEFRDTMLARDFLGTKLRDRIHVDLPEMYRYYNANLKAFDRPARVTWREVSVSFRKHPDRASARRKAEALLARLARGEDFEKLAAAESDGPTAKKGGIWETTPGGFAVPAVNQALESLPVRQLSGILEGPDAYSIVRVESRRAAGPLPFAEVQDEVRNKVFEQKRDREVDAYIAGLRKGTLITTMFDGSRSAPTR